MQRFCSIFSQLLQLFSRLEFQSAVTATKAERHMRGFTCWGQFVYLTDHLKLGATTIAAIYKDRWQLELFFKALKQNLKIKTFVGTSANAMKIQIWTAVIFFINRRKDFE